MSTATQIGQTGITQYAVLKFVKEKQPTLEQVIQFINENFSLLVPMVGYSKFNYITKIMVENNLIGINNNKFSILAEGNEELDFLDRHVQNMSEIIESTGINFEI